MFHVFVSFSNFTGKEKNEIRFQGYYGNDHSFIGVNYLSLDELKGKNNENNWILSIWTR